MKRLAIALTLACAVGCEEKKPEGPPPAAQPPPSTDPPAFPPAACAGYVAAVEQLEACATVRADVRDTFVRIYDGDQPVLTGQKPAPPGALETLCAAREQNVRSVLASQCGPPLEERSVADLRAELDKTVFAIAAARAVLNDASQTVDRAKLEGELKALEAEQATIEALIAKKSASAPKPELPPGVSEECLKNPLAKGCS